MLMSHSERAWWLAGACSMAPMGAELVILSHGIRRTVTALDTCGVENGVLECGEDGFDVPVSDLFVLAFRTGEDRPWVEVESPVEAGQSSHSV